MAAASAFLAFQALESRARAGGSMGSLRLRGLDPVTMDSFFFGCELSGQARAYTFKVEEEDNTEHVLALTMLCLTEDAKEECNVVEVVARNHDNEEIAVPLANLKLSCQPMCLWRAVNSQKRMRVKTGTQNCCPFCLPRSGRGGYNWPRPTVVSPSYSHGPVSPGCFKNGFLWFS
ncbi:nucleoplasmin-3 isoform X2 [Vombatus ursinus]|uniref:nucleoplasmin-3 isoform X2 n=1 Tax=Vombatus ursinus TaxID=29139 RepID=UPI000FFCFF51|nr:nucleoplasmin-3 isoform X2 [Vombatus ursinus]